VHFNAAVSHTETVVDLQSIRYRTTRASSLSA